MSDTTKLALPLRAEPSLRYSHLWRIADKDGNTLADLIATQETATQLVAMAEQNEKMRVAIEQANSWLGRFDEYATVLKAALAAGERSGA